MSATVLTRKQREELRVQNDYERKQQRKQADQQAQQQLAVAKHNHAYEKQKTAIQSALPLLAQISQTEVLDPRKFRHFLFQLQHIYEKGEQVYKDEFHNAPFKYGETK